MSLKKINILIYVTFFMLIKGSLSIAQTLNAEVNVNKDPSEDYLFVALSKNFY